MIPLLSLTRTRARWAAAGRRRRDARHLAGLPAHLLRDMGLEPGSLPAIDRQLRGR
jgi:uncharacterized protein YjiS (DUF1127 family)